MSFIDFLIGRPIPTGDERGEQIGIAKGIPIFGLDALSSAAYGPEAALTLLIPLGLSGLNYIVPLNAAIIVLLIVVFLSYRQTIAAYPDGGGSYTVARDNLGIFSGLLAASALMIDYVLTAAVGISAGIGALTSAVPALHERTLLLCLAALAILTLVNLRGIGEGGAVFMVPTYLFLGSMFTAIGIGFVKVMIGGGRPSPVVTPPHPVSAAAGGIGVWLLLKAFAGGCTAMTGVEAVSNGTRAFGNPRVENAQKTLGIIILSLVVMLLGIAFLARSYGITATDPTDAQYRSILSILFAAIVGQGWFYYGAIASVLLVLIFSANTAFADFPRVCRVVAEDGYLPTSFANRGRRLVYTEGIVALTVLTAILLILFGGVTDRLIPLYAVGAFLAFTLSQAGMVVHRRRQKKARYAAGMFLNGLGSLATGLTVLVVLVAKFSDGAWITAATIPAILALMYGVRRHYRGVERELSTVEPLKLDELEPPLVVIPLQQWSRLARRALFTALAISNDVKVVHVAEDGKANEFCSKWMHYVGKGTKAAGKPIPELIVLKSPYRFVVSPIVDYVSQLADQYPDRRVVTIVPELVEYHWYNYFLHTQRATLLKTNLLMTGNDRISVLNIPWNFRGGDRRPREKDV